MKSFLKFSLLFALIIAGKITKEAGPVEVANTPAARVRPDSMVLVHQVSSPQPMVQQRPVSQEPERNFLAAF